jgi:hypothetical protein
MAPGFCLAGCISPKPGSIPEDATSILEFRAAKHCLNYFQGGCILHAAASTFGRSRRTFPREKIENEKVAAAFHCWLCRQALVGTELLPQHFACIPAFKNDVWGSAANRASAAVQRNCFGGDMQLWLLLAA